MLDLQAVEQRANARTAATPANPANRLIERRGDNDAIAAATPANPANRLIGERGASAQRISQLATLAGVAGDDAIGNEATGANASVSQLAALAGVAGDERITCSSCLHFVAERRRCRNHRQAGIGSPELGLDLPTLLQRCPGFALGPPEA